MFQNAGKSLHAGAVGFIEAVFHGTVDVQNACHDPVFVQRNDDLGTGGAAFHGPYEHITVEGMDLAVEVLKNLVALYRDF